MKKKLVVLLTAFMMLSATACGGAAATTAASSEAAETSNDPAAEETTDASDQASTAANSDAAASDSASTDASEVSFGTLSGTSYINCDMGLIYILPSDWRFASSEQLALLNGAAAGRLLDNEVLAEALENNSAAYEMYAFNTDMTSTINIVTKDISAIAAAVTDEEDYLDASKDTIEDTLTSAGYSDISIEKTVALLAGKDRVAEKITLTSTDGTNVYELIIPIKHGSVVTSITLFNTSNDFTDLLARFTAME